MHECDNVEQISCCIFSNDNSPGSCVFATEGAEVNAISTHFQGGRRAGITLLNSDLCAFHSKVCPCESLVPPAVSFFLEGESNCNTLCRE